MNQELVHNFESWHQLVSGAFVPLLSEQAPQPASRGFQGSLRSHHFGEMVLTEINSDPHTVQRTDTLIRNGGAGLFKINLQTCGYGLLIQDGREVILTPGTLAIYDTSRPYTLTFDQTFSSHVLMAPHSTLALHPDRISAFTATALNTLSPLGGSVANFLHHTLPTIPQLRKSTGSQLIQNGLNLLNTTFSDLLGPEKQPQEEKLTDILNYLDLNLSDPDLTPARIARANFISLRTLHQLFEGTGATVATTLRNKRLERCRAELADPTLSQRPVSLIGARWGFHDPAHFSRAFRTLFGTPPGQYRRQIHN